MADFNSKYTGQQVENLLDQVAKGNTGSGGVTSETDPIFSSSPAFNITDDNIENWNGKQDAISDLATIRSGARKGATAVQPEDIQNEVELITISGDMLADEPTYTVTEAQAIIDAYNANKLIAIKCGARINFGKGWFIPNINIRTQSGISQIFLSGILGNYYIEHRIVFDTSAGTVSATVGILIDLSGSGVAGAEPMVCAYTIGSYTARTIELINHTYNGQTMDYREGAIISVLNPNPTDIVFTGGMVTLDGNEYEANAFTLKSGATALFTLGPDPGVLLPISSVVESNSDGSSEAYTGNYPIVNPETNVFEAQPNTYYSIEAYEDVEITLAEPSNYDIVNEYVFRIYNAKFDDFLTIAFPDRVNWVGGIPQVATDETIEISIIDYVAVWIKYV